MFLVYPWQWSCLKALGLYTWVQWYRGFLWALFGPLKDITWFKTQRRRTFLETLASFGSFTCFRKLSCLLYGVLSRPTSMSARNWTFVIEYDFCACCYCTHTVYRYFYLLVLNVKVNSCKFLNLTITCFVL